MWNMAKFWRFAPRVAWTAGRRVRKNSRQSGGWEVIFDLSFAQQIAYYFIWEVAEGSAGSWSPETRLGLGRPSMVCRQVFYGNLG